MRDGRRGTLLREVVAVARQGGLMLRGLAREAGRAEGPRTVLFVHGFMATGSVFDPMRECVEARTGLSTLEFSYPSFRAFEGAAQGLRQFVERRVPSGTDLSLVGHSTGGLLARWFVQEMGGAERVDRLVLLATPHRGTLAAPLLLGALTRALRPTSSIVRRLTDGAGAVRHIPHTVVVAGADRMVTPPSSAAALEHADVVWIDDLGHNEMLFDARVHRLVCRVLEESA